jgi:hypothetical protein
MGRPGKALRARLISIVLVLGVVLSSLPLLELPLTASSSPAADQPPQSPTSFAYKKARDGKARQQKQQKNKGDKNRGKKKDKKKKTKNKGSKNKKRKRNRKVAPALDAKLIAVENQEVAEDIRTCDSLEIVRVDGQDLCTHGEDPRSFSRLGATNGGSTAPQLGGTATTAPVCIGDGQDGPRVQLVYIHANNAPNRITNLLPTFRRLASEMDTILDQSARKTGGSMRIRFATNASCQVDIPSESMQANRMSSFGGVVNELKARGYNAPNRKYLLLADSDAFCGIGSFQGGDAPNTTVHDTSPGYARVDTPCWDAGTMLHELSHTLGAVQYSAPHTSNGAHCIDEWDVMCYSDYPDKPKMQILCEDGRQDFRLDCGNDDYFAANPAPGSYLANHWNMARSIFFTDSTGETCVDAPTEPDDAYWYAFWDVPLPPTKVGATEQRAFCTEPGDTDWLLFNGEQGATYEITTSDLGPDVDTQLVVYRGFNEQGWNGMDRIGSNDDRAEGDPSSQITFTAPASGSYLIGVSDAASRAGYDATYTITIQNIPTTGAATLDLSRPRARPRGKFTATITGITSGATVQFFLEKKKHTTILGSATANDAGVASALLSIPKGASTGRNIVEATASDGSSATAPIQVRKNGGRKHKGGKHKRTKPGRPKKKH